MTSIKAITILLAPLFGQNYKASQQPLLEPSIVLTQPLVENNGADSKPSPPDKLKDKGILDFDGLVKKAKSLLKIPELTAEESRALDEIEEFLKKYTGNGKFNYGSIPRAMTGIMNDADAANPEAQYMRGLRGIAARRYPNNRFNLSYRLAQKEIKKRAYAYLVDRLSYFRVDPQTANEPDRAPIHYFVTRYELEKFDRNLTFLDEEMSKKMKKFLPPNKKIIFPKGLSLKDISCLRSGEIPPGSKIVDITTNVLHKK